MRPWQSREGSYVFAGSILLFNRVLRDSHVASLLGMTNLGTSRHKIHTSNIASLQGAHYPQGARRIRKAAKPPTAAQGTPLQTQLVCTFLSAPCTNWKCLPEIAPQGHFLALRAQGATSAYGLLAMTNRGPSAILTIACTGCKCVAGSGMPRPYNFPRDLLLSLYTAAAFFSTAAAVFFRRDLRFRPFCDNIRGRY